MACLGLLVAAAGAQAQGLELPSPTDHPYSQPAVSPYLNLTRPGNAGVNYHALVRPQLATTHSIDNLRSQVLYPQNGLGLNPAYAGMGAQTGGGHAWFMNYHGFFLTTSGGNGGSGGGNLGGYPGRGFPTFGRGINTGQVPVLGH
jgi:hypothetical protein